MVNSLIKILLFMPCGILHMLTRDTNFCFKKIKALCYFLSWPTFSL